MTRATSLHDGLSRLATLVGAPVAALAVAATDATTVLLYDAASFGVAALIIAAWIRAAARVRRTAAAPSYVADLREGLAYVRRDRLVLGIMAMLFVTNLLDQAHGAVFVPFWSNQVLGSPVGIGVTAGSFALGAVLGNLAYTVLAPRLPRFAPFAVGFLIGGAPRFLVLGFDSPLWTVGTVAFAAGVGLSVVNPILGAVMYERVR